MYEQHFGFREKPFSLLPDPAFLYLGRQHSLAYSLLEYGVLNQAGFTVVTGEVGCGKTTLIRHLLNQLGGEVTVGLISNTHKRFADLMAWVLMAFGLDYESGGPVRQYETFVDFLIGEYTRDRRVVLIVDEAQNLDAVALEELRTLSNVNADKDQVVQLVLVGQPELKTTLEHPDLRQLAQRVVAHYYLLPLSEEETTHYIRHRLAHAGSSPDLFTHEACRRVYRYSSGVPRLINLICDTALVYGFAEDAREIDADLVQSVIDERAAGMNLGVPPVLSPVTEQQAMPADASGRRPTSGVSEVRPEEAPSLDPSDARPLFPHLGDKAPRH